MFGLDDVAPLDIGEQREISKLLLQLFDSYPEIDTILQYSNRKRTIFDLVPVRQEALVLSPTPGAINVSRDVIGTEENRYPFTLTYQVLADNDAILLDAKEALDSVALWAYGLEEFPNLSNKRKITDISVVFTSELIGRDESNYALYQCQLSCAYEKYK